MKILKRMRSLAWALVFCQITTPIAVTAQSTDMGQGSPAPGGSTNLPRPQGVRKPKLEIKSPKTKDYFRRGKRLFPESFQYRDNTGPVLSDSGVEVNPLYPVGPGDKFLINFWGRIEDNIIVQINSESKLFIPRIGVVETSGLTYKETRERMIKKLKASLKNVSFTISLYEPREFDVYVLGAINQPGPVRVSANYRVSEVIAAAGGKTSTGSSQFIELRRNGEVTKVDLLEFFNEADFEANPFVTNEDVIFIPNLSEFITITGSVVQPGTYEIDETRELKTIIEKMGGFSIYADRRAPIRISRLTESGERKAIQIFHTGDARGSRQGALLDQALVQGGDEIFIPSSNLLIPSQSKFIYVTGEVKSPGAKPYQISMTVEEYIGASGGISGRANLANAVIYRADGTTVRVKPRMPLEPGDTIYIPEKTFKFWQDHLTVITAFISLATSIIVFSNRF